MVAYLWCIYSFAVWTAVSVQITGRCQGATLVGGCVDTIMPTCSSLCIAAEPLSALDPDLLIDEEGCHTCMKNLSTDVDGL